MSVTVPTALIQNSIFKTKIVSVFEKMRVYAPITTIIRAMAKTIDVPSLSTSSAKNHGLECKTSIGTATPANATISLDNKTDMSVDYCEDDFMGDKVGFKALIKEQILGEITKKLNKNFTTNILAGATASAGTVALGTAAEVNSFLSDVASIASRNSFLWKPRVEHGTVVRAKYQGQPFVIAGATAFKAIQVVFDTYRLTATGKSDDYTNMFKTPTGVWVIDASSEFADDKQMIYGIAGAPIHAFRTDKIREFDDKIVTRTTAGANSGDVLAADDMIQRNYNMGAEVWNKAAVPTTVAAYVIKKLMT